VEEGGERGYHGETERLCFVWGLCGGREEENAVLWGSEHHKISGKT